MVLWMQKGGKSREIRWLNGDGCRKLLMLTRRVLHTQDGISTSRALFIGKEPLRWLLWENIRLLGGTQSRLLQLRRRTKLGCYSQKISPTFARIQQLSKLHSKSAIKRNPVSGRS